jgi:hypothetical protein
MSEGEGHPQPHEGDITKPAEARLEGRKKSVLNRFVGVLKGYIGKKDELQIVETKKLTEQEQQLRGKDLFFQSFRFSQGNNFLQEDIFKWLVAKGYFDNIEVPEKPPLYITEIAVPKKHIPLPDDARPSELKKVWDALYKAKHRKHGFHSEELLDPVLLRMIDKDRHYQKYERPNRQPSDQVTADSSNDPHASFVRRFILNAHPTGSDAFNELHKELAPVLARYRYKNPTGLKYNHSTRQGLVVLAQEWERKHPGQTFFPAEDLPGEAT